MQRDIECGKQLRAKRLEKGWSTADVATLYGNFLNGHPISETHVWRIEEGYIPVNPKRRLILATIYGLALVPPLPGDAYHASKKPRAVDLADYRETLFTLWKQGYSGNPNITLKDLRSKIRVLHDTIPYTKFPQKEEMKKILCGYNLRIADILREIGEDASALRHLSNAVTLAQEEQYPDWEAVALYRRGEYYFDKWDFKKALGDFGLSLKLCNSASQQVKGRILNLTGLSMARSAQTGGELAKALKYIDVSGKCIGQGDDPYTLNFNEERYLINRAQAAVISPNTKIHLPDEAMDSLEKIEQCAHSKRFRAYVEMESSFIQAIVYLDRGYFPVATEMLLSSIKIMERAKSNIHLPLIQRLYKSLNESPYGNSPEVTEIELHLLLLQHPHLLTNGAIKGE